MDGQGQSDENLDDLRDPQFNLYMVTFKRRNTKSQIQNSVTRRRYATLASFTQISNCGLGIRWADEDSADSICVPEAYESPIPNQICSNS